MPTNLWNMSMGKKKIHVIQSELTAFKILFKDIIKASLKSIAV